MINQREYLPPYNRKRKEVIITLRDHSIPEGHIELSVNIEPNVQAYWLLLGKLFNAVELHEVISGNAKELATLNLIYPSKVLGLINKAPQQAVDTSKLFMDNFFKGHVKHVNSNRTHNPPYFY